jgi:hypothetical protein
MKTSNLLSVALFAVASLQAGNLLDQGNFSAGAPGGAPPSPWILGKAKPDVAVTLENPPGEGGHWVRFVDESAKEAASLVQKFVEIKGGRLSFRLHVVKSGAAIWFLLGDKEVSGRGDTVFSFKITSKGNLLVAQDKQKIADTTGAKATFPGGQTYDLYCDFKPEGDGLKIEIGEKDGSVLYRGTSATAGPISALDIRTHGEEMGSDFYLTDLVLEPAGE